MPKKKQPDLPPEEQKKRFEQLAREVDANASDKELREAVRRVAQAGSRASQKKNKS